LFLVYVTICMLRTKIRFHECKIMYVTSEKNTKKYVTYRGDLLLKVRVVAREVGVGLGGGLCHF